MNRNWKKYNKSLVRRGEIMLSFDAMEQWSTELKEMNRGKEGHQYVYPESFMEALGYCHLYLHLPFRQTEGLIKSHLSSKTKTPTYSAIWKRVNKLHINMNPKLGKDIVIAIDSTGVKVANRGEWMRQKWQKRRGFLKIHVAVDVKSKQITGLTITDDKSHDSKSFVSLVEQSKQSGNVTKVLADGAYDTKDCFSYLYHDNITPGIKTRKNSSVNTNCYPRRKSVLAQLCNLDLWKNSVRYGDRWIIEGVFSTFKRMFGEHVTSHKRENMIHELKMKVCLYNKMIVMQ
jgi:IS5 family transposase